MSLFCEICKRDPATFRNRLCDVCADTLRRVFAAHERAIEDYKARIRKVEKEIDDYNRRQRAKGEKGKSL